MAGGDPEPWGRAPTAGALPLGAPAPEVRAGSGRTRAAGGPGRALSWGPLPRSQALGRGVPEVPDSPGYRGSRRSGAAHDLSVSARNSLGPNLAETRVGRGPLQRGKGRDGGGARRGWGTGGLAHPVPSGAKAGGVGAAKVSGPTARSRKLTTPGLPPRLPEMVGLCSKTEKEFSIRVIVWRGAERE